MKLVHDADSNVEELQVYNFQDIAACARRFADQLEERDNLTRAILVIQTDDGIGLSVWGDNATGYELIGILEAAKFRAYEANVIGDE